MEEFKFSKVGGGHILSTKNSKMYPILWIIVTGGRGREFSLKIVRTREGQRGEVKLSGFCMIPNFLYQNEQKSSKNLRSEQKSIWGKNSNHFFYKMKKNYRARISGRGYGG